MHTNKPTPEEEQRMLDEHQCSIAYAAAVSVLLGLATILIILFSLIL